MDPAAVFVPVVMSGLALLGYGMFLYMRGRLRAASVARIETNGGAREVPLVAAFSGWKGIPWLTWAHSNLTQRLVLHPSHVECRVIRTRRVPYEQISRVDYRTTIGTENIVLEFGGSLSSFVGNTANRDLARSVIAHLRDRGCPLSPRAQVLLADAES